MSVKIYRVKPPKFKVGRYVLNEYELRTLMLSVARGDNKPGIIVKDEKGNKVRILDSGFLEYNLEGFDMNSRIAMSHIYDKKTKACEGI